MSYANREPEWIPTDSDGESWRFVSYKGRYLGDVTRFDTYDAFGQRETVYLSAKVCCVDVKEHRHMDEAATRVETVLHCTECTRSCLPASN